MFCNLKPEAELNTTTFDNLVELVKDYYEPKPSQIVQRYKFNTRMRAPQESIVTYVTALREIAQDYGFGDSISDMIRDRLVCGVQHDGIQKKLLAEKDLTYDKALELAKSIEAAEKNSRQIKNGSGAVFTEPPPKLHYAASGKTPKSTFKDTPVVCYRCGGSHLAPTCKFKEAICRYCKKKGHIVRVCRAAAKNKDSKNPKKAPDTDSKKTHFVQEDNIEEDLPYQLYAIKDGSNNPITMEVSLNDVPVTMELDTGASVSVINYQTYQDIAQQSTLSPLLASSVRLQTYTGEKIEILGAAKVKVRYGTTEVNLCAQVVSGEGPNLMGRDWLGHLGISLDSTNIKTSCKLQSSLRKSYANIVQFLMGNWDVCKE